MAALFTRTYTFVDGTTAYGSQVEAEIGNIVTLLNSLNSGTTNWGQINALHTTSVPLVADCSSGSQDIADFKNNSVIKTKIASNGEITLTVGSAGLVLTTPDGNHTFRIRIDNSGIIGTDQVS